MANNILTSLESISSSLCTIKDVRLSSNFYNSIYCGKYYDKYEVIKDGEEYQLYVIKFGNSQIDNFTSSVKELSKFNKSPFLPCQFFPGELICYTVNGESISYDVVLIKKSAGSDIMKFFTFVPLAYTSEDIFKIAKKFTHAVLQFIAAKVHVEGLSYKNIWIDNLDVQLTITERNNITLGVYKSKEELDHSNKKMILPLLITWLMTLHTDIEEVYSDILIGQLSSFDINTDQKDTYIQLSNYIEERYNIPFTNITTHLFGEDTLDSSVLALEHLSRLEYSDIKELIVKRQLINGSSKYDCNYPSSENRAIIQDRETKKFGFTDNFGHKIIDVKYSMVTPFQEGVSVVSQFDMYYAIDRYGEYISTTGYDSLEWIVEHNCFIACKNGLFTLHNRNTEVISKDRYSWIGEFSYMISVVESTISGKKGYIDINGNEITPMVYDDALSFNDGVGRVKFEGQWHYISTRGEIIER